MCSSFKLEAIWVAISAALATSCMRYPPDRPRTIPASARWAGGWDGGGWVDCSAGTAVEFNVCHIYDETGKLGLIARYRLKGLNRAALPSELRYRYVTGEVIGLENGLELRLESAIERRK
jgi:hypothetical protein